MQLDYLILQNLDISAVVAWPGNMLELHFSHQLNLETQSPWNLSMPTFVDESHHQQSREESIFFANY